MKQLAIILIFLCCGLTLFAQQERSYVKKGNELYQQKKFKEAEAEYRTAVDKKNQNLEGNFNLGDALYKQKQFDKATEQFTKIAESSPNKKVAAGAYHNLGNTLLQGNKLEESIDAYKKSLLNNPKDEETRYNLAYAQEKLKQQQQQQKKDDKNQKDNKDQKQNQDKKKNDDKKDDKKDQNKPDQKKQDKQQSNPDNISKEDAQRMLDALNNDEKQTQEKLKGKKARGTGGHPAKDW